MVNDLALKVGNNPGKRGDAAMLLAHAESPYHRGHLEEPTYARAARNPLCGDWVELELMVDGDGRVAEAWFDGRGCIISQAAASVLCEDIEGKTVQQLQDFTARQMLELLEIPLTPRRLECGLLALYVLKMIVDVNVQAGATENPFGEILIL
jgi:nitrogen fixation protein NifU and related proteins